MTYTRITSLGASLPAQKVTNDDLAKRMDTTHEWIVSRTGIEARHLAEEGELTSDFAAKAAKQAMEKGNIDPSTIDLVIVATATPDDTMPSTATSVQRKAGIPACAAFDIHAACSGFVYALSVADSMIRTGQCQRALVIGAEIFSRVLNWEDRGTCVLFGDGAGAVVLEASDTPGILASKIMADGNYRDILCTTGGVARTQEAGVLTMAGKDVFRHAVQKMSDILLEILEQVSMKIDDIDLLVPHQANKRILDAIGQRLNIPQEKVMATVSQHANTSAASIPLALAEAEKAGRLAPEKIIALQALGSGLTWGACLIRW